MKHILFIVIFTLCLNGFAQSNSAFKPVSNTEELKQKLNDNALKTNSIISDFSQEKHLAFLEDTIMSSGKFWFKKENQLRWEYTKPFSYIIVLDNGKFLIKDEDKTSEYDVTSNKAFKEINDLILSSVRGDLLKEDKFSIAVFESSKSYLVKLSPIDENMKEVLNKVELYFDKVSLDITKVKMIENKDDYTIISFLNRKLNEKIPDNTFVVD